MNRKEICAALLAAVVTFYFSPFQCCFSQNLTHPDSVKSKIQYTTVEVLVVFYTNTVEAPIPADGVNPIKNGIQLARDFFWRNSGAKLNLSFSYLEIRDLKSILFFEEDGSLIPEYVQQDIRDADIDVNQYGIIAVIYPPPIGAGNYSEMKVFGETPYIFLRYPFPKDGSYPVSDKAVDHNCVGSFINQFQKSIRQLYSNLNGSTAMWDGNAPLDYAKKTGQKFSFLAEIFRNFDNYLQIKAPHGYVTAASDQDFDQFPDNDPNVPMDENRYGSDSTKADTDDDGLTDLQEFMAGIYRGSNAQNPDSDFDGKKDGQDKYPLNYLFSEIHKLIPDFRGELDSQYLVTDKMDFSAFHFPGEDSLTAKFYVSWDERYLYISTIIDAPAVLNLDLDLNNDGWWNGRDNYRIVADPFSSRLTEIRLQDATERARKLSARLGRGDKEMWDDEPDYISRFGRLIDERDIIFSTRTQETKYMIKIAIPANKYIGFKPEPATKISIRAFFTQIGVDDGMWATIYEHYSFFECVLK